MATPHISGDARDFCRPSLTLRATSARSTSHESVEGDHLMSDEPQEPVEPQKPEEKKTPESGQADESRVPENAEKPESGTVPENSPPPAETPTPEGCGRSPDRATGDDRRSPD